MAGLGSEVFTFTWKIENFSMCPQQLYKKIESPAFKVEFLENTEWKLQLYPRGVFSKHTSIAILLKRCEGGDNGQKITIMFSLSFLSTHYDKDIKSEMGHKIFQPNQRSSSVFYSREKIFQDESGFLPNDTLTVRCRMNRCLGEQKNVDAPLEYLKTDCWNSNIPKTYECSARTCVRVSSSCFVWPIKRIGELPCNVKLSTSVPSVLKSEHSFELSFYLKEDPEGGKRSVIEIHKKNADANGIFVRCQMKTLGAPRNAHFRGRDEQYFWRTENDKVWIFPTFFNMKDLAQSYLSYTDGDLYLECDFSFSSADDPLDIVSTRVIENFSLNTKEKKVSSPSTKNFSKLYLDGEFVDATIRVQDREFKVHKFVLVAGSDVFRRMFGSGMKEEKSGIVDIADLEPDTVERLLKYLYTDELEEMNPEDAEKLYFAADKYNMGSLKFRLVSHLTASLSVNNVCKILVLAHLHRDEDLMASVEDYIYGNADEIFHSSNWKVFTETHGDLAAKTMLRVFTRKCSAFIFC